MTEEAERNAEAEAWRHPVTGEDSLTWQTRRHANAMHGLWLTDEGELIPIEDRDKYERAQRRR